MNTTSVCQIEPAYVPLAGRQSRDLNINIKVLDLTRFDMKTYLIKFFH